MSSVQIWSTGWTRYFRLRSARYIESQWHAISGSNVNEYYICLLYTVRMSCPTQSRPIDHERATISIVHEHGKMQHHKTLQVRTDHVTIVSPRPFRHHRRRRRHDEDYKIKPRQTKDSEESRMRFYSGYERTRRRSQRKATPAFVSFELLWNALNTVVM
jgi:hypothetical protein